MINIEYITKQIFSDWEDSPVTADICINVLSYLTGREQQTIEYITYELLRNVTKRQYDEPEILKAMRYFCASGILSLGFQFIDDTEDVYLLQPSDLAEAKEDGYLTHPGNGRERVEEFESKVFYYFSPTELTRSL